MRFFRKIIRHANLLKLAEKLMRRNYWEDELNLFSLECQLNIKLSGK